MAKFSGTTRRPLRTNLTAPLRTTRARTTTHEGGAALERDPRTELFLLAATNMVGEDTFYERAALVGRGARPGGAQRCSQVGSQRAPRGARELGHDALLPLVVVWVVGSVRARAFTRPRVDRWLMRWVRSGNRVNERVAASKRRASWALHPKKYARPSPLTGRVIGLGTRAEGEAGPGALPLSYVGEATARFELATSG